jgi:glycosyltransferase involved in cell wall biosynthesis
MKALVLAFGHPERAASTIYRVTQYRPLLAAQGIELDFIVREDADAGMLDRVAAADVVLNQKCLLNRWLGARIRARAKRLVFDYDDAMWTRPGRDYSWFVKWRTATRLRWWLGHADAVIAANGYLADWAQPHARRLEVLPMALDLDIWKPAQRPPRDEVVVGWVGSPTYLPLVERLEPALRAAIALEPRLRLAIYCGQRPDLAIPFTHVPYAPGTEAAFVQGLDIGLLPMDDDAFGRGKSPIKSLQYLACGVPVVGNFVGATHEIVDPVTGIAVSGEAQWTSAIIALARDPSRRQVLGAAGMARMRDQHDRNRLASRLGAIIRGSA